MGMNEVDFKILSLLQENARATLAYISGEVGLSSATIRDHITIAPSTVIGAGAIIMKNTEEEDVYIAPKTEKSGRRSSELNM